MTGTLHFRFYFIFVAIAQTLANDRCASAMVICYNVQTNFNFSTIRMEIRKKIISHKSSVVDDENPSNSAVAVIVPITLVFQDARREFTIVVEIAISIEIKADVMGDVLPTVSIVILNRVVDYDVDHLRVVAVFTDYDCEGVRLMCCSETTQ